MERRIMSHKKPIILVFAGPNGSGKSTITGYFEKVGIYTNADDIVAATGMDNEEAARFVDQRRYKSISEKEDFTFETVLSSEYKLNILEKAKAEGYFVKCVFVLTVNPIINITRVKTRVASGGHDVDREKIVKRLMELCDILHVYDNTIKPVRIVRKHKEDISIFPNTLWSEEKIMELIGETTEK